MLCFWCASLFWFSFLSQYSVAVSAEERPYIISGFDDVLRQAENTSFLRAALKILEKDKSFTGMSELSTGISQFEKPPKFAIVSAISNWLDGRVDRFLRESKYPENRRYLRHWLTEWSIEDFKIQKIAEIIERLPYRDYIVIFDNSNASIGLATRLAKEFPGKIKTVYLRRVVEKATPKNAVSFFSAFDIAMHEFAEGRLGRQDGSDLFPRTPQGSRLKFQARHSILDTGWTKIKR